MSDGNQSDIVPSRIVAKMGRLDGSDMGKGRKKPFGEQSSCVLRLYYSADHCPKTVLLNSHRSSRESSPRQVHSVSVGFPHISHLIYMADA